MDLNTVNNKIAKPLAIGLIIGVLMFCVYLGYEKVSAWKHDIDAKSTQQQNVSPPQPQIIHTSTEVVREVAVQAPSQEGAILQFVERQGKVIAIVNGREVEVPNVSGNPDVQIGENGELRFSTMTTTKIDVTEMANAQARLVADRELAEQAKLHEAEVKKEKSSRNKERLFWIIGTAGGAYLLTK